MRQRCALVLLGIVAVLFLVMFYFARPAKAAEAPLPSTATVASPEPEVRPGQDPAIEPVIVPATPATVRRLTFKDIGGNPVGYLDWTAGKFTFKGNMDDSARIFFVEVIRPYVDNYLAVQRQMQRRQR